MSKVYEHPLGGSYLELAKSAIQIAKRPLSPSEMLQLAHDKKFVPKHLFGATMHKTLTARLSENIREYRERSIFFRTGPNTFFLKELARSDSIPEKYKKPFIGHLRSKRIRKENILVAPRDVLKEEIFGEFVVFDRDQFGKIYADHARFEDREAAELDDSIKQFVTFTLIRHDRKILIYRRGKFTTASDRLKGQMSVGFGGHVNDEDFGLFSQGENAFRANAARELTEELFLEEMYSEPREVEDRSRILGFINVDDSPDAEHHIAVLVVFDHKLEQIPQKGELSINRLAWLDLNIPRNDISGFDLWSRLILHNIYNGVIKLDK